MNALVDSAHHLFAATFGHAPSVLAAAPGRVNFIGEHTDYNDGFVLPLAIERCTMIAARPNEGSQARIRTAFSDDDAVIDLTHALVPAEPKWANYVRGVIAGFWRKGIAVPGFDGIVVSDVPAGGGLSSSAALEVATATLLEALTGHTLAPADKALLCQRAEHDFAGVPCGIMDQFASVFGRENTLLLLDCRSREIKPVAWPDPAMSLLVVNSGVQHELASGEYAKRRRQCEAAAAALGVQSLRDATQDLLAREKIETQLRKRARHVITENQRVLDCADALERGDFAAAGRLMYASHASLRTDYEVSCSELDALVGIAQSLGPAAGVHGARMTGGGFGGSVIVLAEAARLPEIPSTIVAQYLARTGITAIIFPTRPAQGARLI